MNTAQAKKATPPHRRIANFRAKKGWSLRRMAAEVGLSLGNVHQIEIGNRAITAPTAKKYAAVMGVGWPRLCADKPQPAEEPVNV